MLKLLCIDDIYIYIKDLSKVCKLAYVRTIKSNNFLLKNNNYIIKSYIFKIKYTSFNTNLLF